MNDRPRDAGPPTPPFRIVVGADRAGADLAALLVQRLADRGHAVREVEASDRAYYAVAAAAAALVSRGEVDRGVLVCGTGMGMAIVANKCRGVYAAVCGDPTAAARARSINNANVLTLGAMVTAPHLAGEIVDTFLATDHCQGWSEDVRAFLRGSMDALERLERQVFVEGAGDPVVKADNEGEGP